MAVGSKADVVRSSSNVGKELSMVLRTDTSSRPASSTRQLPKRPRFDTVNEIFDFLNGMTVSSFKEDEGRLSSSSFSETTARSSNRMSVRRSRSFRDSGKAAVACIKYSFTSDPSATRFLTIVKGDGGEEQQHKVQVTTTTLGAKGLTAGLQLKFATPQDYVDLWNEETRSMDLAMRGKLTLQGDRAVARRLSTVMEAARKKQPQRQKRTPTMASSRKSSLFAFPSFSSSQSTKSVTINNASEVVVDARNAASSVANFSTLLEEEYEREFERLQLEVEMLEQKCARLEVQNIVTAAQQLDLLCRFVAMAIAASMLSLYWKLLWFSSPWVEAYLVERSSQTFELSPIALFVAKYVVASLPFVHHWYYSGLAYRRIHVFCVVFLMILRIRMTRWRSDLFAKESAIVRGNLSTATNGENDDGPKAQTPSFGQRTEDDDIWEANYEINARFLYMSILQLRGLWTKSAQYMSSRADFMPTSYVRELAKLQDEAPSTPWRVVQSILQREGVYDQLTDMEETPIASASIGQVHVARLARTGEKVVVKVQHPHARRLLTDDFRSLRVIARIVSILEPDWKFLEILINEWAKEARRELDFKSEMRNLQTANESAQRFMSTCQPLRTNSTATSPQPVPFALEVPRPFQDLCTRDVLVMSFCEGKRVDDQDYLRQNGLPQDVVMDAVSQSFAYMLYSSPIFNGDPHPGNVFVRPNEEDGGLTVVVLDWGLAKRLADNKRKGFCQMALAASTMDYGLMLDAFSTIGLRLKREDVGEDMENIRFILRDIAPRKKARRRIKSKMQTDMAKEDQKVPVESKAYPGEIFFFVRTNELLHGLGSKLEVDSSYMDTIKPYAERGLRAFMEQEALNSPQQPQAAVPNPSIDSSLTSRVQSVLTNLDEEGDIAGAQVCVVNKAGETVVSYCTGHMGGMRSHLPMTMDSVILGFSCTKAIAATLAHVMVQEGYLTYDEPLCERVWPNFCPFEEPPKELYACWASAFDLEQGWKWKRSITLGHILNHTAGLATEFPPKLSLKTVGSCEDCAKAYEFNGEDTLLPQDEPGSKCAYHFMTYGWILAGTLMGAYRVRHKTEATFEEIYEKLLRPKLPAAVVDAGFFPCGGHGHFPKAETHVRFNVGRLAQMQREAESVGDSTLEASDIDGGGQAEEEERGGNSAESIKRLRESFRGREFLMDPRIWNCSTVETANVPAAGGRFSATALAHFYHALGNGGIVRPEVLAKACTVKAKVEQFASLQGQTSSDDFQSSFGLGYQIITFDGERAFGHAGIGGSVGFYHFETGTAVGVMLNKYDADRGVAMKIVRVLTDYVRRLPRGRT